MIMTKSTALISLKNLNFTADKKHILQNISFEIRKNDFITIVGPNGSGKSTLLKIILGILKQTNGTLKKQKNLTIGYVPQQISLSINMPINVLYFLKLQETIASNFLDNIVKKLKIESLLSKQITVLSQGEMQKVLLAKSLLKNPDLLILDEPAQNLDISAQLELYQLINDIYQKEKKTILMISHDLHMVMSSTKKVICLYHHICCQGKPKDVAKDPKFISIFGNNMDKLVSIYNHYHNHHHG